MLLPSREAAGEHRPADINALPDESRNLACHGARREAAVQRYLASASGLLTKPIDFTLLCEEIDTRLGQAG
jgi:hypothetical protein